MEINNEVDALSISIISDINEKLAGNNLYVSAVTGSRHPLRSFRNVLDAESQQMARSPNTCVTKIFFDSLLGPERRTIMNSVRARAKWLLENECDMSDYDELKLAFETSDIKNWSGKKLERLWKKQEIADNFINYFNLYYVKLMDFRIQDREEKEQEAKEIYRMLDNDKKLRKGFDETKELVKEPTKSLIEQLEKFVQPGGKIRIKKKSLRERLNKIKELFDY